MDEFDPNLFLALEDQWHKREGSLVDLKEKIPCVLHKVDELAEFVRDMIAMANTARRRGEPAYMLYGVDNDGKVLPEGIKGQCTRAPLPQHWDDTDMGKLEHQQNEIIGRDLHGRIRYYVRPEIEFDYLYGQVGNCLVSYIKIWPSPVSEPFTVKEVLEDRTARKTLLKRGLCWKREGESKVEVLPREQQFLYSWREVPYISKAQWRLHLRDMVLEYEDVDWEQELYVPLMCEETEEHLLLRERADKFLADEKERVLVIKGRPGAGKSTFLRQWTRALATTTWQNLDLSTRNDLGEVVPIFVDLNGYAAAPQVPFKREVAFALDLFGHFELNRTREPERILTDRNLKFLVCLDALDEMDLREWKNSVAAIQSFQTEFPNVKVAITTRPEALPPRWEGRTAILAISPLTDEQIYGYLARYLDEPDTLYEFLIKNAELLPLMGNPLMLKATVDYWKPSEERFFDDEQDEFVNTEVPLSTGRFVDHLFSSLFEHERDKDPSPDRDIRMAQQITSLSDLALYMDGKITQITISNARKFVDQDLLRLRNMGVIQVQKHTMAFLSELTQTYFAALGLKHMIEEEDDGISQVLKQMPDYPSFWRGCLDVLKDLTEKDISLLEKEVSLQVP